MLRAAAALAKRMASGSGGFSPGATARAPLKGSPAAVGSVGPAEGSAGTERDDDMAHAGLLQRVRGAVAVFFTANADAGEGLGLGFVWCDDRELAKQLGGQCLSGGGIQNDAHTGFRGDLGGSLDGGQRGFELHEQRVRSANDIRGLPHMRGREALIRATGHGDAVFAFFIDEDEGDTGRGFRIAGDVCDVDAFAAPTREGLIAEGIAADAGDEAHTATGTSRGHGLIRALASSGGDELAAEHGFTGTRQGACAHDHVGIRAAEDDEG